MRIRQNPLWLWTREETSLEIQNRGTNGPKIGHVSSKNIKNNKSETYLKKQTKKTHKKQKQQQIQL